MSQLGKIRDTILQNAELASGERVLDVGTGDGLLGFEALHQVGAEGHVTFDDISRDLIRDASDFAAEAGVPNATFITDSADNLQSVSDGEENVVVMRAVLIYVKDKARCFREFHRVLAPGGRLSLCEPINRFGAIYVGLTERGDRKPMLYGYDLSGLGEIGERVIKRFGFGDLETSPMLNFDERDLMRWAREAGFTNVGITYSARIVAAPMATDWDFILQSAMNPNVPSLDEALGVLSASEREQFLAYLRRLVDKREGSHGSAECYLVAEKAR